MDKILEFCGFKKINYRKPVCNHEPRCHYYKDPSGGYLGTILPILNMNFFFKYVVPKLEMPVILSIGGGETEVIFPSYFPDEGTPEQDDMSPPLSVKNEDPNEAWQEALLKLIEG